MQKILIVPVSLFLIGCGGSSNLDKVNIVPLVKNKLFYEEDLCKDPNFSTYKITNDALEINSYNDSNYSDLVDTKYYPIVYFKDKEMKIKKNENLLTCSVGYEITDKKEVTMLELDCVDANNTASLYNFLFFAYDTKKSAYSNRNECK